MCVINDPLDQTHSPAIGDHYPHLKFVLFCEILKSIDGRTDTTYENSDQLFTYNLIYYLNLNMLIQLFIPCFLFLLQPSSILSTKIATVVDPCGFATFADTNSSEKAIAAVTLSPCTWKLRVSLVRSAARFVKRETYLEDIREHAWSLYKKN